MSKQEIICAIQNENRSAASAFLDLFDEESLRRYLTRLTCVQGRRGRDSVWVRPGCEAEAATASAH